MSGGRLNERRRGAKGDRVLDITCWKARHSGLPPRRHLPSGLEVTEARPGVLYYPNWALVVTVSFRTPLTGELKRYIPVAIDALTDRMAILPGPAPVEQRDVPAEAVLEAQVVLTEERLVELRASLLPFLIRRLRLMATPTIEVRVVGLVHKELLVHDATMRGTACRLYVDTLTAEWTLRPIVEGGAVLPDAPPQLRESAGSPRECAGSPRERAGSPRV